LPVGLLPAREQVVRRVDFAPALPHGGHQPFEGPSKDVVQTETEERSPVPATPSTADPRGAREHARAQGGTVVAFQPTVPATDAVDLPVGVAAEDVLWDERLGPGGYASRVLPRGARLQLVDPTGEACVGLVAHNARALQERLNVADTGKLQWNAYVGAGSMLLSDMGRVLLTIERDDCGVHDLLCGTTVTGDNLGDRPNGRDRFLLALARHDLGRRDLPPNLNLFKGAAVAEDGVLSWRNGSAPGATVVLRAELDVLVSLVNVPHPLDDRAGYPVGPVRITAWSGPPTEADDAVRVATPESTRAFENTEEWLR
jgi:urea carboxylase-associated protein 2